MSTQADFNLSSTSQASWSDDPVARMALWTDAQVPAPQMLRALAEEYGGRTAPALRQMAKRVEAGESLEDAFQSIKNRFPRSVRNALRDATSDGNLRLALPALASCRESSHALSRGILAVLTYPVFVLCCLLGMGLLMSMLVVGPFREIYQDFSLDLPSLSLAVLHLACWFPWITTGVLLLVLLLGIALLYRRSAIWVHWFARSLPLVGRIWQSHGHHRLSQLLSAYTAAGLPAPTALLAAADGLNDYSLAHATRKAAEVCRQGESIGQAFAQSRAFERSFASFLQWGEQHSALASTLADSARFYEQQTTQLLLLLRKVATPIVLLVAVFFVLLALVSIFLPLVGLIQGLS